MTQGETTDNSLAPGLVFQTVDKADFVRSAVFSLGNLPGEVLTRFGDSYVYPRIARAAKREA